MVLGSILLNGGLWVGAVWVAVAGFVGVLVGLFRVTAKVVAADVLKLLARLIGLGDGAPQ